MRQDRRDQHGHGGLGRRRGPDPPAGRLSLEVTAGAVASHGAGCRFDGATTAEVILLKQPKMEGLVDDRVVIAAA